MAIQGKLASCQQRDNDIDVEDMNSHGSK